VGRLRTLSRLPVLVGVGIKDGDTARRVAEVSDGVVIGAAVVDTFARLAANPADIPAALEAQLREIRNVMDQ
jgi:tryptophan synthase alpha chain